MADPRRGSGFGFKFFLLLVYIAAYAFLRYQGEIVMQQVALPAPGGGVEVFRMVGAQPDLPHWRQQTWRAVFSLAMVLEEEGRKLMNQGMDTYRGARGGYNGGQGGGYGQQYPGQGQYSGGQNAYQGGVQQGVVYQGGPQNVQGPYQGGRQSPQAAYPGMQGGYQGGQSASGERVVWDGRTQPMSELPKAVRR